MTQVEKSQAAYDNNFIKNLFVISFITGSLVIIFFSRTFNVYWSLFIPMIIMLLYFYLGIKKSDIHRVSDQFADSIYYLGFLYTLVALAVSLYAIHEKNYTLEEGLIARFGLALATTIFGLFFRIYIVNFRQNIDDLKKITEGKLTVNVERFATQIDSTVDELKVFNKNVINKMETLVSVTEKSIEDVTSTLTIFTDDLAKNLDKISSNIELANTRFVENYESTIEYTIKLIKHITVKTQTELFHGLKDFTATLIKSVNDFVTKLDEVVVPSDIFTKKLEEPLDELILSLRSTIDEINMIEVPINIFTSKFDEPLKQFSSCLQSFSKTVESYLNEHQLLDGETRNLGSGLQNLNNHISDLNNITVDINDKLKSIKELSLNTNQFATSFKYATKQIYEFNEQTKEHISSTRKLSGQFEQNLNLADNHRAKIKEALDDARDNMSTMYTQLLGAAVFLNDKLKSTIQ